MRTTAPGITCSSSFTTIGSGFLARQSFVVKVQKTVGPSPISAAMSATRSQSAPYGGRTRVGTTPCRRSYAVPGLRQLVKDFVSVEVLGAAMSQQVIPELVPSYIARRTTSG
jgi:hypothetical protein